MDNVPIFIITCDRMTFLRSSMLSYSKLNNLGEIIIHDNGSSFPPMECYLRKLESSGIRVYFNPPVREKKDLNNVNCTIQHYFQDHRPSNYIVTDCDIELICPPNTLEIYSEILDKLPNIEVVGPMLNIHDLPDHYPKKREVLGKHLTRFWNKQVKKVNVSREVLYIDAFIDTTFGMYRKGFQFKRHQYGIRTHSPYLAKHLDWYVNPKELTPDLVHYSKFSSNEISHWYIQGGKK
jgi:hypothetical protein